MMSRPKRIVCYTFGSRGDLNPFLALGRELIRRGHAAVIASTAHYREVIEAEGIEFQPMRPHLDVSDPAVLGPAMHRQLGGRYILSELMLPALDDAYQDSIAAGRGPDLLILHPLALAARL